MNVDPPCKAGELVAARKALAQGRRGRGGWQRWPPLLMAAWRALCGLKAAAWGGLATPAPLQLIGVPRCADFWLASDGEGEKRLECS
jgi:hypothetical protein